MRTQRQINKDLKSINTAIYDASGTAKDTVEVNILALKQLVQDLQEAKQIIIKQGQADVN